MAAEDEAVVDAFGLGVFERREVGEGGGFGFVEDGASAGLEFRPAGPIEFGGVGDLAQEAAPFDDDAVDVARTDEVVDVIPVLACNCTILRDGSVYLVNEPAV